MKKILFPILSLLVILTAISCSKDNDDDLNSKSKDQDLPALPDTSKIDSNSVTVMYYGCGGGNLDKSQIQKIRQCVSIGATDKVNMTFEFKFSKKYQYTDDFMNYSGVLRMDLADAASMKGCHVYAKDSLYYNTSGMPFTQYSTDNTLNMTDPDEIIKFIRWSASKHPAKKYVLVLADHGGGWNIQQDEAINTSESKTRAMFSDDNVSNERITAKNVAEAVNKSGINFEVLFMDCCLMSAWENFYEYKRAPINYVVSSMEVSYSGHYYDSMLGEILKTPNDLKDAFMRFIDYRAADLKNYYVDYGIYDLTKIAQITPLIKEIGDSLKVQLSSTDDVTRSIALKASRTCLMASTEDVWTPVEIGKEIVKTYGLSSSSYSISNDGKYYRLNSKYVKLLLKNHQDVWDSFSETDQEYALTYLMNSYVRGVSLGDMLKIYKDEWNEGYAEGHDKQIETATRLYNSYVNAMREIAYIYCTRWVYEDQPYVETSPSVNMMALNENGWKPWEYSKNYDDNTIYLAKKFTLSQAIALYSQSTFAKETGWCEVQQANPYNPSPLVNDSRMTRYYTK